MMLKSPAKIKPPGPLYDFKEDIQKLFSQFSILNLCSEIYFFEEAIYRQFFFQIKTLNSKKR